MSWDNRGEKHESFEIRPFFLANLVISTVYATAKNTLYGILGCSAVIYLNSMLKVGVFIKTGTLLCFSPNEDFPDNCHVSAGLIFHRLNPKQSFHSYPSSFCARLANRTRTFSAWPRAGTAGRRQRDATPRRTGPPAGRQRRRRGRRAGRCRCA